MAWQSQSFHSAVPLRGCTESTSEATRGSTMKRTLIASVLALGLYVDPAPAADLPVKGPIGTPWAPGIDTWTGFYIGVNGGGAWSDNTVSYSQLGTGGLASASFTDKSGIGGAQAGFNWQMGWFVAGVEIDLDGRHWGGSSTSAPIAGNAIDLVTLSQNANWLGTARGRLGFAFGDALLYATGGAAAGEVEHSITEFRVTTGDARNLTESPTKVGWVAGAGLEYRVWHNVSVGVEYLHVDLGNTAITSQASVVNATAFQTSQATFTDKSDIVRAKLNWLFGGATYWP
jgi:outer membrane immunogenic protein